jgi:hypothetical protein
MKRKMVSRNHANIVKIIVNLHHVLKWVSRRRLHAVLIKIVISKFAFLIFLFIIVTC